MPHKEFERIKEVEGEFSQLFARMDVDRDLALLNPYVMKTLDGNSNAEDVANVTLAEPKLFLGKSKARIGAVERQTVIESLSNMSDKQTTDIENFLKDMEYEIDSFLNKRGEEPEFITQTEYACIRGHLATQVVLDVEGDTLIPDVRPIDCRYFIYEYGARELKWASPYYERTKLQIDDEYPGYKKLGQNVFGVSTTRVYATWTPKREIVYIGGQEAKNTKNKYKEVPIVIQLVPAGSMLMDRGYKEHRGESIFEVVRTMFPEKNFIATILKTKNYALANPPLQEMTEKGRLATPPKTKPSTPGRTTMIEKGGGFSIVPEFDMRNYTRAFLGMIDGIIQRATFSNIDFGTITFPLSAVAMATLAAGRHEILLPRLQALALLWQARSRMIIRQFRALGRELKIGEEGHKRTYNPSMLDGEYVIKYRYFTSSKEEQASDAAIANAMRPDVSEDFIRRNIYKLSDPDGEKMKQRAEQAERLDPVIGLYRQMVALIDAEEDLEARLTLAQIEQILRQRAAPQVPSVTGEQVREERQEQAPQILDLFSKGNAGGGVKNQQLEQGAIIPEGGEGA